MQHSVSSLPITRQKAGITYEWVDHHNAVQILLRLQIFCQQVTAGRSLCCRYDGSVPEREFIAVLYLPASLEKSVIHSHWKPCQQVPHLCPSIVTGCWPFAGDVYVELLQNLKADPAPAAPPE